jgi:hypothetical protein
MSPTRPAGQPAYQARTPSLPFLIPYVDRGCHLPSRVVTHLPHHGEELDRSCPSLTWSCPSSRLLNSAAFPPLSLPVTAAMKGAIYHHCPPPSGPYKRPRPRPVFATPIPALHLSSPSSSATTTKLPPHHHLAIIARPPRCSSHPGELRVGFATLPSPCPTPTGELPSLGATGG